MGRLHYLDAFASECPEAAADLIRIWEPFLDALLAANREVERISGVTQSSSEPEMDPEAIEAAKARLAEFLAPMADVLGIPLPPLDASVQMSTSMPPSVSQFLPDDHPLLTSGMVEMKRCFRRHARWMHTWRLPAEDIGWSLFTVIWGFSALESRLRIPGTSSTAADVFSALMTDAQQDAAHSADGAPALPLLDGEQMRAVISPFLRWLDRCPLNGSLGELGKWFASEIETALGPASRVSIPRMTWNPRMETRAAAEARMRAEADRYIKARLNSAKEELSANGAEATPLKTAGLEHFRWLVLYQVKGQSQRSIAREVYRDRHAVRDAITKTAQTIGLPLRTPNRPGRPRRACQAA